MSGNEELGNEATKAVAVDKAKSDKRAKGKNPKFSLIFKHLFHIYFSTITLV